MPGMNVGIRPKKPAQYIDKKTEISQQKLKKQYPDSYWSGGPEQHERVPTLLPNQLPLQEQQVSAAQNEGAGGAFGDSADYWRKVLSDDPSIMEEFSKPEMRKFNEEIIPDIAERYAGMGSGGLSSSGFRNATVNAGTDLQERLGALRSNLRQNAASNLYNAGQGALGNYSKDVMTQAETQGAGSGFAQTVGALAPIVGSFFGPWGTAIGAGVGALANRGASKGQNSWGADTVGKNTNPYGLKPPVASSKPGNFQAKYQSNPQQGFQLPNFMGQ